MSNVFNRCSLRRRNFSAEFFRSRTACAKSRPYPRRYRGRRRQNRPSTTGRKYPAGGRKSRACGIPFFGVAAEDAQTALNVARFRREDIVEICIIGRAHSACALAGAGDVVPGKFGARGRIDGISLFLRTRTRRLDDKLFGQSLAGDLILENKLRHRRAADIAEADKQYSDRHVCSLFFG